MNKIYGLLIEFSYIREDRTRIVVSYNLVPLEDGVHAIWNEIYFYKKQHPFITFEQIKESILTDINNNVKLSIIDSLIWNGHKVWLSTENQANYKSYTDLAIQTNGANLPIKVKFGDDSNPDYYIFTTVEDIKNFWIACNNHIITQINKGWSLKDSIDWSKYNII